MFHADVAALFDFLVYYHPDYSADEKIPIIPHPRLSNAEIARRGKDIYASQLRDELKKQYIGKFVIIDIETGNYEIGHNTLGRKH